jgi:hypothetical protein
MKTQFPIAPPERLIEDTGDGLKFLRTLQARYEKAGDHDAAIRVSRLLADADSLLGDAIAPPNDNA